ncbi:MAG: L,D-transpeptidase family protein [Myxococcaceae bacterium]|nr:L,D-transpeptidase family protein [Myxococcaceae bacterium]
MSLMAADRVATARTERTEDVKALWSAAGLKAAPAELYLRAFKKERQLEVWAGAKGQAMVLLKTYPFCAASGELGPKRREGDLQVPEGFYEVSQFNPTSTWHLSIKVSYPNASDRVLSDRDRPGGLIYLHGGCASIGCIAIGDREIEEVYLLATDARVRPIHFDIFPSRACDESDFSKMLAPGLSAFEKTKRPPRVKVDAKTGAYQVSEK